MKLLIPYQNLDHMFDTRPASVERGQRFKALAFQLSSLLTVYRAGLNPPAECGLGIHLRDANRHVRLTVTV